tara:strand:- start:94 stop:708 length:615 start_codon:yes stop_codon:yes gene_type:complete
MTTTTVQPMEPDNNYYSYRNKKKTKDVVPILYLDNGLTIYTEDKAQFMYNNKGDTNNFNNGKMNDFIKKFSDPNMEQTPAEKESNKLEAIIVDFKLRPMQSVDTDPLVLLTVNPNSKLLKLNNKKSNDSLNKNEIKELIDIGNSFTFCPDAKTPKCLLGFTLKTDEKGCSIGVCNEKSIGTFLIDLVLVLLLIGIVYLIYRHFK